MSYTPEVSEKNLFSEFPLEVKNLIFESLPVKILAQASLVCKEWEAILAGDFIWKKICMQNGLFSKNENQTWKERAIEQAKYWTTFIEGEALKRTPVIYRIPEISDSEGVSLFFTNLQGKRPVLKYEVSRNGQEFVVMRQGTKEVVFSGSHQEVIATHFVSYGLFGIRDVNGFTRIWDLTSKESLFEGIIDQSNDLIALRANNSVVIFNQKIFQNEIIIHAINGSRKVDLRLLLDGMAIEPCVQGNILAMRQYSLVGGQTWVKLLDVEKGEWVVLQTSTMYHFINGLFWEGDFLYVAFKESTDEVVIDRYDFSKRRSSEMSWEATPLDS